MNSRTLRLTAGAVVAVIVFYVATVGAIPVAARHIEDGRLQRMRSSSFVSTTMKIYEWPASHVAAFPPMRWMFELSAAFWCGITDAPETTA